MKTTIGLLMLLCVAVRGFSGVPQQINYQGFLTRADGSALDTTVAMTFTLYPDSANVPSVWSESRAEVQVFDGLFNVRLGEVSALGDAVLNNSQVWLGITVGTDAEMTPRTRMVSAGYSFRVGTVDGAMGGVLSGNLRADTLKPLQGIRFGNGSFQNRAADTSGLATRLWVQSGGYLRGADNVSSTTGFVGGGNHNRARGEYSVVNGGGGQGVADSNSANGEFCTVGGGSHNSTYGSLCTVGGGGLNSTGFTYATVSGGWSNAATGGAATIGGGFGNTASGFYSTIGGGLSNAASADQATVSGGSGNAASNTSATVGGGASNSASGIGATVSGGNINYALDDYATISGGLYNYATGVYATVSGGSQNSASGFYSAISGGYRNTAIGSASYASGYCARANHDHAFVWGSGFSINDSTASYNDHTFTVRCPNGARFYTGSSGTTQGVQLSPGGGAWSNLCDVRRKRLHGKVNTAEVLRKLSTLPLHRWSYKTQDESIQHIGPTAQDFRAAFGLGESDTTINTLDPDGVSLAAIQELIRENEELRIRVTKLEAMMAASASADLIGKGK